VQRHGARHDREAPRGEAEAARVHARQEGRGARARLERAPLAPGLAQHPVREIQGHHARATPGELERRTARARAHVERALAGPGVGEVGERAPQAGEAQAGHDRIVEARGPREEPDLRGPRHGGA
jgi:hypothetical protein